MFNMKFYPHHCSAGEKYCFDQNRHLFSCIESIVYQIGNFTQWFCLISTHCHRFCYWKCVPLLSNALNSSDMASVIINRIGSQVHFRHAICNFIGGDLWEVMVTTLSFNIIKLMELYLFFATAVLRCQFCSSKELKQMLRKKIILFIYLVYLNISLL
jgi:hypothetical protein